ncbi:GAF domain-containing protein [Roseivivax sp. GX 12232]|uniref:HWE histidine kinase domain-containing protein n=1 Tax=Roseivivax sp. GX 12232 TaxID=2900547 RepID=UPI001E60C7EF|nr:HWE histidine kinase domain-containing protein [Roseivivax sp. GX 12232]MCE0503856.1 GAF domain-containing protein [Roseivivax sp. GX 12232]
MSPDPANSARATAPEIDLSTCDREEIHLLGRVQSYGALIAVSSDWIVQHASENLARVLGPEAEAALGRPFAEVISEAAQRQIRDKLRQQGGGQGTLRLFGMALGAARFDLSVHQSGRHLVLEFEPAGARSESDALSETYPLLDRVRQAQDFETMCAEGARAIQALCGFDSVMVYRFEPDRSGRVVAESQRGNGPSYLGLRFPASDIPSQARALYTKSLLRLIADVSDPGAAIVPPRAPEGAPLDLSLAVTRAVSPVHIQYLKNMGVKASMSVSILKDGELWGLFACHNRSPRFVPFETRTAIELFAHLFAYELVRLEEAERRRARDEVQALQSKLLLRMTEGHGLAESLRALSEELAAAIPHDGAVLVTEGKATFWGSTPPEEAVGEITRYLNTAAASRVYASDRLGDDLPAAADYARDCAGVLAIPISRSPRDYLMLCRRELKSTVHWAGNPEKPAEPGPTGLQINPRRSFEVWKETVEGQSAPWSAEDHQNAEDLRTLLLEIFLKISDQQAADRARAQERQELLISELNHRVRNILNLMRGLITQSGKDNLSVADFSKNLDARIHALARAHDQLTREDWAPAALSELLHHEFAAYLGDSSVQVRISGPDVLLASEAYTGLALVVHEMVTNSVKYGALSDTAGHIALELSRPEDGGLEIRWREVDGPKVTRPERRGFGSAIIERSLPYELGGEAEIAYPETGVEARFRIPASYLAEPERVVPLDSRRDSAPPRAAALSGAALVVEDSMIVAMDAGDILAEFGATQVETAGTVKDALAIIAGTELQVALLDVNLGAEQSLPVAEKLAEMGVPFVLTTGYGDSAALEDSYPPCEVVQKPFSNETIAAALVDLGLVAE